MFSGNRSDSREMENKPWNHKVFVRKFHGTLSRFWFTGKPRHRNGSKYLSVRLLPRDHLLNQAQEKVSCLPVFYMFEEGKFWKPLSVMLGKVNMWLVIKAVWNDEKSWMKKQMIWLLALPASYQLWDLNVFEPQLFILKNERFLPYKVVVTIEMENAYQVFSRL